MKRIIFTLVVSCLVVGAFSQTAKLKVNNTGVGIDTDNPQFPLHVNVADNTNGIILGNASGAKFFQKVATNGHGQLFVRNGGNSDRLFLNAGGFSFLKGVVAINTDVFPTGFNFHVEGNAQKTNGGNVWAVPSDKRLKSNINEFTGGLSEVLKINPVEFEYNGLGGTVAGEKTVGIIAQEIQKIAPYMVGEYSSEKYNISDDKWSNEIQKEKGEEYLYYDGNALQYMLVNAIKEQQEMINELIDQNKEMRIQIEEMAKTISQVDRTSETLDGDGRFALLEQNIPNPFHSDTKISYFIPESAQYARLHINSNDGKILKSIDITTKGKGVLELNAENLPFGSYHYTLEVDGEVIGSKTMILAR